ncbi:MAG: hypothetical protein ACI8Z7_000350 [Candidatus Nanohaloarchaea archaeon]|jgi:hypothetical protein
MFYTGAGKLCFMEKDVVSKVLVAGLIGVVLGGLAVSQTDFLKNQAQQNALTEYPLDLSMTGMHTHDQRNVPADEAPSVSLEVEEDSMMKGHYNLRIQTENFEFAPENVSSDFVMGEGHAHVFVDDVKISRSYNEWYHLPRLKPGEHTIKVTLNTNNHQEYAVNGETVMARETVTFNPN